MKPARIAIHEQFINQITHAKGLQEFRDSLADQTVIPTPGAVLLASELLAKGSYEQEGVGGVIPRGYRRRYDRHPFRSA